MSVCFLTELKVVDCRFFWFVHDFVDLFVQLLDFLLDDLEGE